MLRIFPVIKPCTGIDSSAVVSTLWTSRVLSLKWFEITHLLLFCKLAAPCERNCFVYPIRTELEILACIVGFLSSIDHTSRHHQRIHAWSNVLWHRNRPRTSFHVVKVRKHIQQQKQELDFLFVSLPFLIFHFYLVSWENKGVRRENGWGETMLSINSLLLTWAYLVSVSLLCVELV